MNSPATAPTSTAAIISLVAGILAWLALPPLGAIVAVVAGHMARTEIRQSAGTLQGDGLAVAGLVLGYLQFVLGLLAIMVFAAVFGGILALGAWGN
jgi:apolipoprotein N-acyltransferase